MSRLFRSRQSSSDALQDACWSLLDADIPPPQQSSRRGRGLSAGGDCPPRPWRAAAESRPSWTTERPPPRKLVKDMNGSGRPSFSLELSDSEAEKEKGLVRRQIARL
ncbi:uncharacterized protein THITE_2169934, partial [Thermothielavioides terrestris NRRL 8126]